MTKAWRSALGLAFLAGAFAAQAQTPSAASRWQFDPSVYALGSLDNSTDFPFGAAFRNRREPLAAANLGAGLDVAHQTTTGWFRSSLFGLARSPFSDFDRTLFGAGWVEASRRFGSTGRLTFSDEGKGQGRPNADVSDYWYNAAALRAEWHHSGGGGFELQVNDRRRGLPDLKFLGFSQQSVGGGALFPMGAKGRARLGAEVQRYSAPTAEGGRAVAEAEWARFTQWGIATVRLAWFQPFGDRRLLPPAEAGEGDEGGDGEDYEFADVGRSEFFEMLTFRSAHIPMLEGSFFFDPFESESEQWDFGRRKLVLACFASRRFGTRSTASAFLRFQHKVGPNLLLPADAEGSASFVDDRIEARAAVGYKLRPRATLLFQGWYVEGWSARQPLDFRRFMLSAGIQIHF
jgi:hypothetical protein